MKKTRFAILSAVALAIVAGGWIAWHTRTTSVVTAAPAPPPPKPLMPASKHADAPGFDRRETGAGAKTMLEARQARQQAAVRLQKKMPLVRVDFDERLGSPRFIGSPSQFLTGSNRSGGAATLGDFQHATKAFIAENAALFGHGPELLEEARIERDYVTPHNGMRTTVWQQQVDGVRVFESTLQAHVTAKGELVNIASRFIPDARAAAKSGMPDARRILSQPPVDGPHAISAAAATVGDSVPASDVVAAENPAGVSRKQAFSTPALLDLTAEFVWLPLDESAMRLCWEVIFTSRSHGEMFRTLVDASNGDAVLQQRLTEYISPSTFRVFTSDSPTPMSPGHATPLATQPPQAARGLVTLTALDTNASPNGWIEDGVSDTRGNNVDAHLDRNADNQPDTPRPQGVGAARVFDPPLDLTKSPATYGDAAVVNLFYWNNLIHDRYHALGFTEAAGNFQVNNFGRGGLGNDAVQADAQDGSGTDNANFSTPADGSPGRMQMYNFTGPNPDRDGDFDQEIVIHEYTHGLSNRLVGGGVGMSALQSRGMGEGWSDFYSLCLLGEDGDNPTGTYASGAYASYQLDGLAENYYFGIRRYPYCSDLSKNPLTFKDIDPSQAGVHSGVPQSPLGGGTANEVHNQGEVWCVTLWDVRANLIAKHGAAAGNDLALRLVTDGMKLSPANPNFVQARDAILQAELVDSGGANRNEIWAAFAKRGLGAGASSPASSTTSGLVESFDLPDTLSVTPSALAISSGSIGGPFSPSTFSISLYNAGTTALPWTVTSSEGWLSFTQTGGALATGGLISLEASLNAGATTLSAGNHAATITFTNHDTGVSQTRTVMLKVDYLFLPVFQDNFETGALDPAFWTVTGTGTQRTEVTSSNGPHAGTRHLTMDSSTDLSYSRNEATLSLNLTGRNNLVLRFWVKMFNDEADGPPTSPFQVGADFDGIAISTDGTDWYEVQPLRDLSNEWQQLSVDLDAALAAHGLSYGPNFRIRFNHFDNYGISTDGFAFDDVMVAEAVNRRIQVTLPAAATEGGAPLTGTVTVTPKPDAQLGVDLTSDDPSEAGVPASVVIPAGTGSATFSISLPDDNELDGTQTAKITAASATYVPGTATIAVHDTESAVLSLDIPASAIEGGGALTGNVNLSAPPARTVKVSLSSGEMGDVLVPAFVEIPAGQTSAPFVITVVDDGRIDGTVNVTVTAHVENWTDATAMIAIEDNEAATFTLTQPDHLREGDPANSAMVVLPGTLPTNLVVSLASSDTGEATVPPSVTIYARQTSATFAISVVDDALQDGPQPVTFTASAAGFPQSSITTTVADNEVASLVLSPVASPQIRNAPFAVTVTARDISGATILNHAGSASLSANGQSGPVPCSPGSASGFVDGVCTVNVTIGAYDNPVILTVVSPADGTDVSATSNAFAVTRGPLSHFGWADIPASQVMDTPFAVSLRALDAGGNLIDDFTGSASLGAVTPGAREPTGTGTGFTYAGLDAFYSQSRFQCIYTPAELGAAGRLTGLDLDLLFPTDIPLENFTVRLKHTPLLNFNSSQTGWETDGWTVVHSGPMSFATKGWNQIPFSAPFEYDGTSNLMVDFSFNNPNFTFGSGGGYSTTTKSDTRKLYFESIGYPDPLTWSSPSFPAIPSNALPNLRFTAYSVPSPIRPTTTGAFAGGLWSGMVSVPFAAPGVELMADGGSGSNGISNPFAVQTAGPVVGTGTIYAENFETTPLSGSWLFTGTSGFRTQVTTSYAPHGGSRHLVMDNPSYQPCRNEATWTVDLSGMSGLTLKFWAKEGTSETPDGPPPNPFTDGADFDGVAISVDGTKWYEVQGLRTLTTTWTQYTVNLDSAIASLGLTYNSTFKIRFNQYGYDYFPYRGIAVDDIEIISSPSVQAMQVSGPSTLDEGAAPALFTVSLPFVAPVATVVTLTSSAPAKATIPATVTIPAGRQSGYFNLAPVDDSLADGAKPVRIIATSQIFPTGSFTLTVLDNDLTALTFGVPTTSTVEGNASIQGTVGLSGPAAAPVVLNLTSSNPTEISVPATIIIPVGSSSAIVPLAVVNDNRVDGTQSATVTVSVPGTALSQSVTITVADDETFDLRLQPSASPMPVSVSEGTGSMSFTAYLPGTVTTATTLTFGSSAPTKMVPPAAATISADSTSTSVSFTIADDLISQPSESITLTVGASGFNDASYALTFLDNDPHHFTIAPIASPQVRGAPIAITVNACDAAGAVLPGFSGGVTISANGSTISPASLTEFTGGVRSDTIRVHDAASDVVLTVSDTQGHTGSSNPFDVGNGAFQQLVWAPIGINQTPGSNITTTVQAQDAGGNLDPTVDESITVQALTPVPALTIGDASDSTSSSFLYTYYARARAEVIYLASEIGGHRTLGGISLNVKSGAAGQLLSNFTIRLKTTTRATLDSANGWDGDGWAVVHQSNQTLSENGWTTFLFDVPFEYDGRDNLLVDYSFNSAVSPSSSVTWNAKSDYSVNGKRTLYGYTSSATDPLTWSGTSNSPSTSYSLPQTRLLTLQAVPVTIPASPSLAGGIWSGGVSFGGSVDRVFLDAVDSSGHRGTSNGFRVGSNAITSAALPFNDGFESGSSLASVWNVSSTASGRVTVTTANTPHTGTRHAVLDSSSGTARAELTLPLDLAGYSGVVLDYWAKRFGGSANGPPAAPFSGGADFDGVAMSADGTNWYEIQPLRTMSNGTWTRFSMDLDAAATALGLVYTSDFRIRFNQYGSDYAPYDGIAIDDVSITGNPTNRLQLSVPATIAEGAGPLSATVTLPSPAAADTTVALTSSSPLALSVPAAVTIPAGQISATFTVTPIDNAVASGPINITLSAFASGIPSGTKVTQLSDDDTGTLSLLLPPTLAESAGTVDATLTISPPAVGTLIATLSSSLPATLQSPATVRLLPGQTKATFPLTVISDSKLTGPQSVTVTASVPGWLDARINVTVEDDEKAALKLSSSSVNEGSTSTTTVSIGGTIGTSLVVSLTSSDPSRLTVPATVTIPAGSISASVPLTGVDNIDIEGMQTVTLTATAPEMVPASASVKVYDNEVHHFYFATVGSPKVRGAPFAASITARDLDDRVIPGYNSQIALGATGDAGLISRTPTTAKFTSGSWNGNVTVNTLSTNVRLQAPESAGHANTSNAFDVIQGNPTHYAWSNIGSLQTAGQPFTATITALDEGNNTTPAYTGYVLLASAASERIIGSGTTSSSAFPFLTSYHDQRTQVIYHAGEVGSAGILSSLSLYVVTKPGQTLNAWTIRLKHTPLASYAGAAWEGSGWTTVFSSNQTIPQTGWVTFNFTTPFAYNGTSNLMVDFSFNNSSYSTSGAVRTFAGGANRTLSAYSNSGYGDPRGWTATSPYPSISSIVPQIKLNAGTGNGVAVNPTAVLLTGGTWTGGVRMGAATNGTAITATDFTGKTGQSGTFNVQASSDGDADGLPDFWENASGFSPSNSTGNDGAMGDPDLDGISNLLEYAFNLNPRGADVSGLPSVLRMTNPADGSDYLEFAYRRRIGAVGINYIIETSADCINWSTSTANYQNAAGPLATGDGISEIMTVRVLPGIDSPGTPMKYIRLRVNTP